MSNIVQGSEFSQQQVQQVIEFAKESTKNFDDSHDWRHAVKVMENAVQIVEQEKRPYEQDVLLLAALCHDIVDSKYKELSIDRKELEEYLLIAVNNDSKKQERILNIIDNISWSKEVKGLRKPMDSEMDQYLLNVVSDADRLEAIGDVGVQRCIQFTTARGGRVPEDVVQHCHDKLLRIASEFIRTETGKKLAQPLHQAIADYVQQNS